TTTGAFATSTTAGEAAMAPAPARMPKAWIAGWASAFVPGGGFVYLHQYGHAAGYLGVETAELGATVAVLATSGYKAEDDTTHDRANRILLPGVWLQDTHALGIYDAYRAARIARGNEGYRTPIPQPGLPGLLTAAVRWRTVSRPRVALPVLATLAGGVAFSLWMKDHAPLDAPTYWQNTRAPLFSRDLPREQAGAAGMAYYGASFYMVGIGEESLFRGVLQTTFEEWWGPWPGLVAGSVVFGCAHFANDPTHPAAGLAQVGWTMLLGSYLGWMYLDDGHDLRASVALHTWYDFSVGLGYFLADPRHQPFAARVTIPF
ncbi:MAG TPA: CPBP family intramembrane glutamic endopeptidase, partial [bacterium]|nr:CPBP family intramembrane glutamic endopeptidase [bacterium]